MLGRNKPRKQPRHSDMLRSRASNRSRFHYYSHPQHSGSSSESQKLGEAAVNMGVVKHRLRLAPSIIAVTVILLSFLISLTLSTKPAVTMLDDQASPYRPAADYEAAAEQILADKLSNRSKLTIDTAAVEQAMLKKFPELEAAVLRLPVLGRRATLVLDIQRPSLLLATQTKSFVLDRTGTVVSEAAVLDTQTRVSLLVIRDMSGLKIEIGKQAVTSNTVQFINGVTAHLEAQQMKVAELTLPVSANQLDVRIEGATYYVKMDVAGDARLQVGSYLAVRDHLAGEGNVPSEYIDVRVEEKVFYK